MTRLGGADVIPRFFFLIESSASENSLSDVGSHFTVFDPFENLRLVPFVLGCSCHGVLEKPFS